jgi:AraC family transcriptional regulator
MNCVETIFETSAVKVTRFSHPTDTPHSDDDEEEYSDTHTLSFVERGSFEIFRGGETWRFQQGDVIVSGSSVPRGYRHANPYPEDVCLSFAFTPEVLEEGLGRVPSDLHSPRLSASSTTAYLKRRVDNSFESFDPVAVEAVTFDAAVAFLLPERESKTKFEIDRQFSWHSARIDRACALVWEHFDQQHSLSSLAREAGMSTFHFARVFKQLVGESPNQYLVRRRLAAAARMLREGATVTGAAFDSGFRNLSHFIRVFKRRLGVSPGRFRQLRSSQVTGIWSDDQPVVIDANLVSSRHPNDIEFFTGGIRQWLSGRSRTAGSLQT